MSSDQPRDRDAIVPGHSDGAWALAFAPRAAGERRYWLVKSEPGTFSFDDLQKSPARTTRWDGVRNFTARNFLRDGMKKGDQVFFYHSSAKPTAVVGICEVVKEGYPDPGDERFTAVDLRAVSALPRPVTLAELKATRALANMALLRIGRLSVTPVTADEWKTINSLASR